MKSLIGQRGYSPNQYNKFSPIQRRQIPNSVDNQLQKSNPASQAMTKPEGQSIAQPLSRPISTQQQTTLPQLPPPTTTAESFAPWQEQAGVLLKEYGPSLVKQIGPPLARKVGLPIVQRLGPTLARRVGIPFARRVGLPLARRVFLPLAKRAGFALIRRMGLPF